MPAWFAWFVKGQYPLTLYLLSIAVIASVAAGTHYRLKSLILCSGLVGALLIPVMLPWAPKVPSSLRGALPATTPPEAGASQISSIVMPGSEPAKAARGDSSYLLWFWSCVCGSFVTYYFLGYIYFAWYWRSRQKSADGAILECFDALRQEMGIRRRVQLYLSGGMEPSTFGLLRPCVVLPEKMACGLGRQEIRSILIHELSHVKRLDWLMIFIQRLAESVYFFHPLVWWISRSLAQCMELSCDEDVVRREKDRVKYARTILSFLEFDVKPGGYPMRRFAIGYFGSVKHRIRQIVAGGFSAEATLARKLCVGFWGAAMFVLCLFLWGENDVLARYDPVLQVASDATIRIEGPGQLFLYREGVYTITLHGQPGSEAELACRLSENLEYLSSFPNGIFEAGNIRWRVGDLHGAKIQLKVRGISAGPCAVTGQIGKSRVILEILVNGVAAMHLSSYDTEDPVAVGDDTVYVVEMRNEGTAPATNIRLADAIPERARFVNASGPVAYRRESGEVIFDPVPVLAPGEKLIYTITVKAMRPGSARNSALLRFDQFGTEICDQEGTTIYE